MCACDLVSLSALSVCRGPIFSLIDFGIESEQELQ
jgi:hypothetical protein